VRRAHSIVACIAVAASAPVVAAVARAQARPRAAVAQPAAIAALESEPRGDRCPAGMTLVDGDACPRVEQTCLRWLDPPGRFHEYRCAEYARPARCLAPRVHSTFCIDRLERADPATALPLNEQSWTDAARVCGSAGERVCLESEWTFACEGEEMRPYPYGWSRNAEACNADHVDLLEPGDRRRLRDEREPSGAHPACASPFGVLDMAGNVAEWVSVDGTAAGTAVVQKGNWWQPGKHACRDAQAGHDRHYKGTETGFRCCADAAAPSR
jgi:sulfatase modifying factor 1